MAFFEKVNPLHPDKIADRLGGFCVDLAKKIDPSSTIAGEVLIGHGKAHIIIETSLDFFAETYHFTDREIERAREEAMEELGRAWDKLEAHTIDHDLEILEERLEDGTFTKDDEAVFFSLSLYRWFTDNAPGVDLECTLVKQNSMLMANGKGDCRCGDNGIFIGTTPNGAERVLTDVVGWLTRVFSNNEIKGLIETADNKNFDLILCMSNNSYQAMDMQDLINERSAEISSLPFKIRHLTLNPLGEWKGGLNVDSGAVNRKLGSDMGRAVSGGGLHFKDLSKADITLNICCNIFAEILGQEVRCMCAIGDDVVKFQSKDGLFTEVKYSKCVEMAQTYIDKIGGFEEFAKWGLLRPQCKKKN